MNSDLLGLLGISESFILEELNDAAVCNLNQDKILVLQKIESLKEMEDITFMIPTLQKQIRDRILRHEDTAQVSRNIPLSRFLWDIYVVGLHDTSKSDKFYSGDIMKIQHDRYIARKIVIEYVNNEDLLREFNQLVMPERALDQVLQGYESEEEQHDQYPEVERLLTDIDFLLKSEDQEEDL